MLVPTERVAVATKAVLESPLPVQRRSCDRLFMTEPVPPFRPGYVFAERYRVERLLARGGHSMVFVAEQLVTETRVALKVLWPHLMASEDDAGCFELEAKVASRVQSEFIVRVLDAGVDPLTYTPYLAMELLEGSSLSQLVRDGGPLSPADAVRYLSHVAHGLESAHRFVDKSGRNTPIVHRDLKPDNLFLSRRGSEPAIVKILDYGVAKVVSASITTTANICGTPAYMAYEQISGGNIGPGVDIWAFGLVAFFLLTGKDYWLSAAGADASMFSIFAEVLHRPIAPPSKRALELGVALRLPSAFDAWFLHCVTRDSSARFPSAETAQSALARALTDASVANPSAGASHSSCAGSWAASSAEVPSRRGAAGALRTNARGPVSLGATFTGAGVTFALFSQRATGVELCLFDAADPSRETARILLTDCVNHVFRIHLPNVGPGQLYGYRVHGLWAPEQGQRFNPHKLLLDPYARSIVGELTWHPAVFGYELGDPSEDLGFSSADSAPYVPRCKVCASTFEWGDDAPPGVPWCDTVIYETHVKGMTIRHPDVPTELRGTYLGLVSEPILEHLLDLGITAVELLPVYHSLTERHLDTQGLSNYWGYNPIGFFSPDARYATRGGDPIDEFKAMVKGFHAAGIEVLLDVVYNHTAEGDRLGPTLCFRGIDNACYYRLVPENPRDYQDFTGCGNSLSLLHPRALQLVLDSLRFWATEMHVDGFRFDLLPTLARDRQQFDGFSRFLAAVQQDPALGQLKLIAEPWDLGPEGNQLGAFPAGWSEWNGRYRDSVRRFWRGDADEAAEFVRRFAGSSDLFGPSGRGPEASINFVTCHDGFTLEDMVSYTAKRNAANGHENADGSDESFSANWGEEGPSSAPEVVANRACAKRNLISTLLLSAGVPMLAHGDELGRSQHGNNNAYCQDNELNWLVWELSAEQQDFFEFTCEIVRIAREYRALRELRERRRSPLTTLGADGSIRFVAADGHELTEELLADPALQVLGILIPRATPPVDASLAAEQPLLLIVNASAGRTTFSLPALGLGGQWHPVLDTASVSKAAPGTSSVLTSHIELSPRSLVLLRHQPSAA